MSEEIQELGIDWTKDARLTAAQRKKMSSGTFCGPGRSFPVPDCAHVTAARRLIGRYKGSAATKAKILACVSRKAKSLGCNGKDEAVKNDEIEQLILNEDFDSTREIMAFTEACYLDSSVEEQKLDDVKDSAINLLDALRQKRTGTNQSHAESYKVRSLNVILDLLLDEIKMMEDSIQEPGSGEQNTSEVQK